MRIDELPYHSSVFDKVNFVPRRQFFLNIGITRKMHKKILKQEDSFALLKTISLKTCTLSRTCINFLVQFFKKSILPHK